MCRTQVRIYSLYSGQQGFNCRVLVHAGRVMIQAEDRRTVIHIQQIHCHLSFTPQTTSIRRPGNQIVPLHLLTVQRHGGLQLTYRIKK